MLWRSIFLRKYFFVYSYFLVMYLSSFAVRVIWGSYVYLASVAPLSFFGKIYETLVKHSLNIWWCSLMKPCVQEFFLCGRIFSITILVFFLVIVLFRLFIFPWINLVVCGFLGICSFHLDYLIYWQSLVYSIFLSTSC